MDLLGLGAVSLVAAEWLALGWLSGVDWPPSTFAGPSPFWLARCGLWLLFGSCLVGLAQLVLAALGPGFGGIPLVLVCASLGAAALRSIDWRSGRRTAVRLPEVAEGAVLDAVGLPELAGWLLLGLVLTGATARALLVPETGWDAYSHWGLRAQAYALAGTIVDAHSEHEYYPPLLPLLEAWLALHRGVASIDLNKTVSALIGSAFGVCLAWHLRLSLSRAWFAPWLAVAIVLVTTALLENFWTGQADLSLAAYFSLVVLAMFQWQRAADRRWLVQAALFAAAAALTKLEGLPRLGIVGAAVALETLLVRPQRQPGRIALALVPVVAAAVALLIWSATAAAHGISSNAEHLGEFRPLAIGSVLISLAAVFGGIRTGGGLLAVCLAWAVAGRCLLVGPLRLISLVVLGELTGTLLAFLLSSTAPDIEVRTSATRLFEQFLPLALFAGAVGVLRVRL